MNETTENQSLSSPRGDDVPPQERAEGTTRLVGRPLDEDGRAELQKISRTKEGRGAKTPEWVGIHVETPQASPPKWLGDSLMRATAMDHVAAGRQIAVCGTCNGLLVLGEPDAAGVQTWSHSVGPMWECDALVVTNILDPSLFPPPSAEERMTPAEYSGIETAVSAAGLKMSDSAAAGESGKSDFHDSEWPMSEFVGASASGKSDTMRQKIEAIYSGQPPMEQPLREPSRLVEMIGLAIGEASMCWNPRPSSAEFDATAASRIADELVEDVRRHFLGADDVKTSLAVIGDRMRHDLGFAWSWHCSIAAAFVDEWPDMDGRDGKMGFKTVPANVHWIANKAAARFLAQLFPGVDTTKHPGFPKPPEKRDFSAVKVTRREPPGEMRVLAVGEYVQKGDWIRERNMAWEEADGMIGTRVVSPSRWSARRPIANKTIAPAALPPGTILGGPATLIAGSMLGELPGESVPATETRPDVRCPACGHEMPSAKTPEGVNYSSPFEQVKCPRCYAVRSFGWWERAWVEAHASVNTCSFPPETFWGKVRRSLFPARYCETPAPMPGVFGRDSDCIVMTCKSHLSWKDRVRVFLSGNLVVESKTITQYRVGVSRAQSEVWIAPPTWALPKEERGFWIGLHETVKPAQEKL